MLEFQCGDPPQTVSLSAGILLNFLVGTCSAGGFPGFAEETVLTGSYSCAATGVSATWTFTAQ